MHAGNVYFVIKPWASIAFIQRTVAVFLAALIIFQEKQSDMLKFNYLDVLFRLLQIQYIILVLLDNRSGGALIMYYYQPDVLK